MTVIDRRYSVAEGQAVKSPCVAATTANITLAGLQTIDGVSLAEHDRVLVKNQSTASQNGIYDASSGNWTRSRDFDGAYDIVKGTRVWVHSGSVNGTMEFFVTTADPITVDTSSIAFSSLEVLLNAAPGNVDYIVKTANAALTAERVATDAAPVSWDFSTPGQAKIVVDAATTSASGISELATSAEAIAGADTVRAVTPAALAAAMATIAPRGYGHGCTLSNDGSDPTNDIAIAAGVWRDSTDAVNLSVSAMIKRLDANWAAGTAAGMRNSAAAIANATYHLYAVRTAASAVADIYAVAGVAGVDPDSSASVAAVITALHLESGGSAYAYARRIGSILRESAAIVLFTQNGDHFERVTPKIDINSPNPGVSAVTRTLSVPLGIRVKAEFYANMINTGGSTASHLLFTDLSSTDSIPNVGLGQLYAGPNGAGGTLSASADLSVWTNTSGQIRSRNSVSDAGTTVSAYTHGWNDSRGRTA